MSDRKNRDVGRREALKPEKFDYRYEYGVPSIQRHIKSETRASRVVAAKLEEGLKELKNKEE
ncbi:hypothetical protein LXA47_31445 [Massilia sp. P8910]|uniref:hypothetical protein n=1 Tax=Massilia antarctica TaxID=2765360 RepID=UPI001E481BA8|nr:hypothetical protein [Massilia antarctica]MCE3608087.1 hypothetical protein [Massilia antarctica]